MGKVGRRMGGESLCERIHPSTGMAERVPRAAVAGALQADRPLSVLALTPAHGGEAVSAHMRELARGFAARGERYRIMACGAPHDDGQAEREVMRNDASTPVAGLSMTGLAQDARAILRHLLSEPVDVIHTTTIRGAYAAAGATFAQGLRRPRAAEPAIVTTLHSHGRNGHYGRAACHLRYLSDGIIVPSCGGYDALVGHGLAPERLSVVALAGDLEPFARVAKDGVRAAEIADVPAEARVVVALGGAEPPDHLLQMLDAWAGVADTAADTWLVFATEGGQSADSMRARVTATGAAARVALAPAGEELVALLARASVVVVCDATERGPARIIEAMAARRPVVAVDVDGAAEGVEAGATGVRVGYGDVPGLAQALRHVLEDGALAERLARAGSRHAHARYGREALAARMRAIYVRARAWRASHAPVHMGYEA